MPGTNITTAKRWKNFLRAFKPRVGILLSAASSRSVATFDTFVPLDSVGKFNPNALGDADAGRTEESPLWLGCSVIEGVRFDSDELVGPIVAA